MRRIKLITKEIEKKAPAFYATEDVADPIVVAKFFTPDSDRTWLMVEYDAASRTAFGFAGQMSAPHFAELGYFSIDELETVRGKFGLPIERDQYWTAKPLSEAKAEEFRL